MPGDSEVAKLFREAEAYCFVALEKIYRMGSTRKDFQVNVRDEILFQWSRLTVSATVNDGIWWCRGSRLKSLESVRNSASKCRPKRVLSSLT